MKKNKESTQDGDLKNKVILVCKNRERDGESRNGLQNWHEYKIKNQFSIIY